jgi:hypothetical protein
VTNRVLFAGGSLINVRAGSGVFIVPSLTAAQINALDIPAIAVASGTSLDLAGVAKDVYMTGSATLSGLASYGGSLRVSGGILDLSDAENRPGPGVLDLRSGGTLDFGATAFAGSITYRGGSVTGAFSGVLNATGTGVSLLSGTLSSGKVVVASGNSVAIGSGFERVIRLEGGSVSSGLDSFGGTLELGASGTLDLTQSSASLATLVIEDGGVLNGTGTVAALTVADGGLLSPGNSPGLTTVNDDMVLLGGGALDIEVLNTGAFDFDPAVGVDYDSVLVLGDLDLRGLSVGSRFLINLISLSGATTRGTVTDFDPSIPKTYDLIVYQNLLNTHAGPITDLFLLDTSAFTFEGSPVDPAAFSLVHNSADNKLQLTYAPIPEPSTYGLMLGGLALAGAALRRRRKKD